MYFIEAILKLFENNDKTSFEVDSQEEENCPHIFLAIDSTADYLACKNCGLVIKNPKKTKQQT